MIIHTRLKNFINEHQHLASEDVVLDDIEDIDEAASILIDFVTEIKETCGYDLNAEEFVQNNLTEGEVQEENVNLTDDDSDFDTDFEFVDDDDSEDY